MDFALVRSPGAVPSSQCVYSSPIPGLTHSMEMPRMRSFSDFSLDPETNSGQLTPAKVIRNTMGSGLVYIERLSGEHETPLNWSTRKPHSPALNHRPNTIQIPEICVHALNGMPFHLTNFIHSNSFVNLIDFHNGNAKCYGRCAASVNYLDDFHRRKISTRNAGMFSLRHLLGLE